MSVNLINVFNLAGKSSHRIIAVFVQAGVHFFVLHLLVDVSSGNAADTINNCFPNDKPATVKHFNAF